MSNHSRTTYTAPVSYPRALRAGVRNPGVGSLACKRTAPAMRRRKGLLTMVPAVWRRCAMGENRISCFGVWKQGTRREALRLNRTGDTHWRRARCGGSNDVFDRIGTRK